MNELRASDIKEAVIVRLADVFPNVSRYQDAMNAPPKFPHFFIRQVEVSDEEDSKNVHNLTYDMEIRYREVSDPSTERGIERKLDEVGLKLLANFNTIDFDGGKIRAADKRIEKVEGVLHFFCAFTVAVKAVSDLQKPDKQKRLTLEVRSGGSEVFKHTRGG